MISRVLCSPVLQRFYRPIRQLPLVGELVHGLVRKVLPAGTRLPVKVRSGAAAGLYLSIDPRYEAQYAAGKYETSLLKVLASHLGRGDVLYDVGAHVGFISLVAARIVGSAGQVYAFEADSENSKRILEHQKINSFPQIEVVAKAVWSECTTLSFRRDSDLSSRNTGTVSEMPRDEKNAVGDVVETVTLNRFAMEHRLPTVVKVDVEGAEEQVLRGADAVFHSARPILICEIHHAQAAEGVSNWLAMHEYEWNWLTEGEGFPRHLVAQAWHSGV
jgi:FkbM family methyltransferase